MRSIIQIKFYDPAADRSIIVNLLALVFRVDRYGFTNTSYVTIADNLINETIDTIY